MILKICLGIFVMFLAAVAKLGIKERKEHRKLLEDVYTQLTTFEPDGGTAVATISRSLKLGGTHTLQILQYLESQGRVFRPNPKEQPHIWRAVTGG